MRYVLLQTLLLLLFAATAACADDVSDTVALAERFYMQSDRLLESLPDERLRRLIKQRAVEKKEVIARLKSLRWSEEPGKRRFKSLKKNLERYMTKEIESIVSLSEKLPPSSTTSLEEVKKELFALKLEILQELEESFKRAKIKSERGRRSTPPPIPSVDASPFEKEPGEVSKGIWER